MDYLGIDFGLSRIAIRAQEKGKMACFFPSSINRGVAGPWGWWSTLGDLVSMLESAWEPSNSLVLARVRINCELVILVQFH